MDEQLFFVILASLIVADKGISMMSIESLKDKPNYLTAEKNRLHRFILQKLGNNPISWVIIIILSTLQAILILVIFVWLGYENFGQWFIIAIYNFALINNIYYLYKFNGEKK